MTHQGGPYVQAHSDPEVIHLGIGQPSPSLLPLDSFRQGSTRGFAAVDPLMLQYHRAAGHPGLREQIARLLASARPGQSVDPEQLFISSGNSLALSWCAHSLAQVGQTVVSEDPSYFLARGIFADAGLRIETVPVTPAGIDVDALECKLQQGLSPAFVYVIPHHQNPTGATLDKSRAQRLEALASHYDFLVVYDDPYELLAFDPKRPYHLPPLGDRALRLGSFSKIYAPGLRLGWIEAKPPLLAKFAGRGEIKSGGGVSPIVGTIIEEELKSGGLSRHVSHLRQSYEKRYQALSEALAQNIPDATIFPADGGYFVWIDFGPNIDAKALRKQAQKQGVDFLAGPYCSMDKSHRLHSFARLSFSFYHAHELQEAVQRLAQTLETAPETARP